MLKVDKRYIIFLAFSPDLEIVRAVIKKFLKQVNAAISNAALNSCQGAVHIPPHLLFYFSDISTTLTI